MPSPTIEVVASPAQLGECPIWNGAQQALYWVDIDGRRIHRWEPSSGASSVRNLPGRPGSIAFSTDDNTLLVAMEHELVWFHWPTGAMSPWLALEEAGTGNRLNDGRTDPAGRLVVGSMFADVAQGRSSGLLHQVESDGGNRVIRADIGVTNSNAFDPLHGRAYFADSFTGSIVAWDYDADVGERSNERVHFSYRGVPGAPDGACVDAEGCLWSASVYGWAVIRITPDGRLDRRIELPLEKPTMPCFGGADLSTLFVTSIGGEATSPAPEGITPVEEGSLLTIDIGGGTQGIPEVSFAGLPPVWESPT